MENINFEAVVLLATSLKKPVSIYDLETTTFRGRANFAITEVSCLIISPDGKAVSFGDLINPEKRIEPDVSRLTGITQDMVRDKETWGHKYAKLFKRLAGGDAWISGFNNSTFDNHAVLELNERYGHTIDKIELTFDVRKLHLKLSGVKSVGGKLPEIAALYGVHSRGALHRAQADVALTAELLNAIVQTYGLDACIELLHDKPKKKGSGIRSFTADALVSYVKDKGQLTVEQVAHAFGKETRAVSFEVGRAIDERLVDPGVFSHPSVQDWLSDALLDIEPALLTQGKLKPLHEKLNQVSTVGEVDYVQLRIGLLQAGLSWASLKS